MNLCYLRFFFKKKIHICFKKSMTQRIGERHTRTNKASVKIAEVGGSGLLWNFFFFFNRNVTFLLLLRFVR